VGYIARARLDRGQRDRQIGSKDVMIQMAMAGIRTLTVLATVVVGMTAAPAVAMANTVATTIPASLCLSSQCMTNSS
jgi:hypothetical protein